ncbi:helix-turn-helix domain-containing protein [Alienimonas chondri]|uniref:Helix-turn-helix domain-containing protein n=1 Tax=Alienimonas chondri TaxID=2681879 RepID=A0ABX1VIY7_9PLAN|nr:helix-turn-helix domain-containing protein [Alienimonas chondri]NNJ27727.1 hypothetical protein [Alienimonas chondri]
MPKTTSLAAGLLTTKQTAALIGSTAQHVRDLVHGGALTAIDIAMPGAKRPRYRFHEAEVDRFLKLRTTEPPAKPTRRRTSLLPGVKEYF